MEVTPGYKLTEVGVIPKDWEDARINDVVSQVGSGITPTGGADRYQPAGRPFVRSQNVGWGRLLLSDLAYIDEATHQSFPNTEIELGDVLLNITGASIGRCALAVESVVNGNVNQHVCIIRTVRTKVLPRFLEAVVLSRLGQQQIDNFQAGGNREGLNFAQVRTIRLPLPPLAEQQAIAEALGDVDALIESLDRLIAKKRAVKQAAMQELLTGRTRLPGFSGEWQTKRLGEIGSFFSGGTPNTAQPEYYGGEIPWITSSDCNLGRITNVIGRITTDGVANSSTKWVKPGTLLIALYGATAGVVAISAIDATINQAVLAVDFAEQNVEFMYQKLQMLKTWILETYTQGGQPNLSGGIIKDIELVLPKPAEQVAIAEVLTDMDNEIAALEARREKTRLLKQGMMQELLTGRTRLR